MNEHNNMVIEASGICRGFRQGSKRVQVLQDVSLKVPAGTSLAIVGASGAGKSTLLQILGGLDKPDEGEVIVDGSSLWLMSERQRGDLRNARMGFIYQFHHLLPEFTALENVAMPLLIAGESNSAALKQASELLDQVGMSHRLQHRPAQLSGGERQRVAIARALVMQPACVLMDEPTGNLDPGASEQVLGLIDSLKRDVTASFIVVTHDAGIASRMDSIYELKASGLRLLEPGLAQ